MATEEFLHTLVASRGEVHGGARFQPLMPVPEVVKDTLQGFESFGFGVVRPVHPGEALPIDYATGE
jgi:hypothetical protein